MDFYTMITERITEYYPLELQEELFPKIKNLEELQKSKYRNGVLNEKILPSIVKAEGELWKVVQDYQKPYANTLSIDGVELDSHRFAGFVSPWEFIGIEKKLFSYIQNHPELLFEKERRFTCDKCWSDPEQVRVFKLDTKDEKTNKTRVDWFRGVVKQRKYFKYGIFLYHCSTCKKWHISSKMYNPHG